MDEFTPQASASSSLAVAGRSPKCCGPSFEAAASGFDADNFPIAHMDDVGFTFNFMEVTAAVPEPATWAMLLAGVGAVGAALRIDRRSAGLAALA
jgi:hypothetical protein